MKSSRYNVFIPINESNYVLINTLSGSVLLIDKELKDFLEGRQGPNSLNDQTLFNLKTRGVIVEKYTDENKKFDYIHNKNKNLTKISSFIIYPTYNCNLSCHYCYEKELNIPQINMHEDAVERIIKFIKYMTIRNNSAQVTIAFFGGEPLLEKDICTKISSEIFNWAKELNIKYYGTLTTNGTLLSTRVFTELGPYISSVQFTLDGCKEVHDKIRSYSNGQGSYENIMNAISAFLKIGAYVTVRVHINKNSDCTQALLKDLCNRGYNIYPKFHIYFAQVGPVNSCTQIQREDIISDKQKKALNFIQDIRVFAIKHGLKNCVIEGEVSGIEDNNIHSLKCGYIKTGLYIIDPLCDLYICPVFTGLKEYSIGSISFDGSATWNQIYLDMMTRNPVNISECRACAFLPLCEGGCPLSAYMKNKSFDTVDCGHRKVLVEQYLKSHLRQKYPEKFQEI